MTDTAEQIRITQPEQRQVALFWLGQAGFVLKSSGGTVLYIDAYLSHSVERKFGSNWKRLMPIPIKAEEVDCDWFISTHEHDDHLDVDSIPVISRNTRAHFAGPRECMAIYQTAGIPDSRCLELTPGVKVRMGDFSITAVFAEHGDLAPDAIGLVIESIGLRIYHTGDTALRQHQMQEAIGMRPQVILPCINGAYSNLDAKSAAQLVALTGAKLAIPTHFWMFVEHMGDPWEFQKQCQELAPNAEVRWLTQGEGTLISASDFSQD